MRAVRHRVEYAIAQLRSFLEGTLEVSFAPFADVDARYARIAGVTRRFGYARLSKPDKGVVLRYLAHTSGYPHRIAAG